MRAATRLPRCGEQRRGLLCYAVALSLAVAVAAAAPMLGQAALALTMVTPALAVVLMLGVFAREGGAQAAFAGLGLDRAGLGGWPPAIGVPLVVNSGILLVLALAGLVTLARPEAAHPPVQLAVKMLIGFAITIVLSIGEEVGWRGYMLPRLLGLGVVPSMLLVGLLHGIWHLPLLLGTGLYHGGGADWLVVPLFLVTLSLAGVFYGYLRLATGSIWPVALAHAAQNTAWEAVPTLARPASPLATEYLGGESGLLMIASLTIVAIWSVRRLRRRGINAPMPAGATPRPPG